jgi:hypothetical protein
MKAKWLPAVAAPALVLGITMAPHSDRAAGTNFGPIAGYELTSTGSARFSYAQITFTVPSLHCLSSETSAMNQAVLALNDSIALLSGCNAGQPYYQLQTEAYGQACDLAGELMFSPSPGDDVELILDGVMATADDLTTGENASLPAETSGCVGSPTATVFTGQDGTAIPDFAQIAFHQGQVKVGSKTDPFGPSTLWTVGKYALRGASGKTDVQPEVLLSGKYTSSFVNDWLSPN